mmetsp:Transcript_16915/g.39066  ORF Transcript_16915/g.39066 Transcript_16915/m.39066 type:complete len:102 (+) Transcript_16915:2-307(+)
MQQQMMMQKQMASQFQANPSTMSNMGMYNTGGSMYSGGNANNNSNINSAIQGMQNMNMGNANVRQPNDDGGFGTPMGGSSQQRQTIKNDAFASLGGMNAFR